MQQVILVVHLMLAVGLVAVVLLQRSEGGALGIGGGGGGGGMSGFLTGRGSANLLTRTTAILAAAFMLTSLMLAWLSSGDRAPTSILDQVPAATAPAATTPAAPAADATAPAGVDPTATAPAAPASTAPAATTAEPLGEADPSVPLGGGQ